MIERALAALESSRGIRVETVSRVGIYEPWGYPDQDRFANAACLVETDLDPHRLLSRIQAIETQLGRKARRRWGPREIDIDILLYDDLVLAEPGLRIPHPRLLDRLFVLIPLSEIAPDLVHPVTGLSVRDHRKMLDHAGGDPGAGKGVQVG
jgi:2-amino-4-hydroxy-6-hydroxymethyldihydropteridine diphosphokinase